MRSNSSSNFFCFASSSKNRLLLTNGMASPQTEWTFVCRRYRHVRFTASSADIYFPGSPETHHNPLRLLMWIIMPCSSTISFVSSRITAFKALITSYNSSWSDMLSFRISWCRVTHIFSHTVIVITPGVEFTLRLCVILPIQTRSNIDNVLHSAIQSNS